MSLSCLDTLVGLSRTQYECFTDDVPDNFDTSDSGFFLTDPDYGLTVVEQCAIEGWTLLQAALNQAILETKTDLTAKLRSTYDSGVSPYSGIVGQIKFTGLQSVTKDYIGQRYRAAYQKGVKFVPKKIYLGVDTAGTYTAEITSNDPTFESPTPVSIVVATGSQFASVDVSGIELPFFSRHIPDRYYEYYITVERNGARPLNNKITCCGNRPAWMRHFQAAGFDATDNLATDAGFSSQGFGLAVDGYLVCEEMDWLCEAQELGGYHLKNVLARTIQFRGAAIAIAALVDDLIVNPCTGYQIETLNSRRAYLNQRYADNIAWIAQNVPTGVTNCFVCKPGGSFNYSPVIV